MCVSVSALSSFLQWGCDLQSEHERFIVRYCNNTPVFVTDFPIELKPFYARDNGDNTVKMKLKMNETNYCFFFRRLLLTF